MRLFMPIQKVEEQGDGTLIVSGIASTESTDSDGEIIQAEAIKAALPDFFRYGTGALREMHQSLAAGTVDEADVDAGVTYITATVVDPVAVTKVKAGVYKGFSVGGKVMSRDSKDRNVITGLKLVEVSLVDRPANPDAVINVWKAEASEEQDMQKQEEAVQAVSVDQKADIEALASLVNAGTISVGEIVKAAQAHIAKMAAPLEDPLPPATPVEPEAPVEAAKAEVVVEKLVGEALQKGMYGLRSFAELLQQVAYLTQDAEWEAQVENDASPLPAQLRTWLTAGVHIFSAMTAEETAELLASVKPSAESMVADVTQAEPTGDLAKAGATYSAKTKAALADIHKSIKDCCDKLDGLGYADKDDGGGAVDDEDKDGNKPGDADKAAAAESLQKADLVDSLTKALAERDARLDQLAARLQKVESEPAAPKGALKAVPVAKAADSVTPMNSSSSPEVDALKSDDPLTLMKAVHSRGGVRVGVPLS